jgi:hypothetical protein
MQGNPIMVKVIIVTFINISVISWQSVLFVEESRGPGSDAFYHYGVMPLENVLNIKLKILVLG